MQQIKSVLIVCTFLFTQGIVIAQTSESTEKDENSLKGWHLLDRETDQYYGISINKAYSFLREKNLSGKKIIVAVIDNGVDTLHEDLKSILWKNPKEIPGNGVDDDKNGYTDDLYGWNFLGGKDGRNVDEDSYEAARVYHALKSKYPANTDISKLSKIDKKEYQNFIRAKLDLEKSSSEASSGITFLRTMNQKTGSSDSILQIKFKKVYTGEELSSFETSSKEEKESKTAMITLFRAFQMMSATNSMILDLFNSYYKGQERKIEAFTKPPTPYRQDIVQDDYKNFKDRSYGNQDVMAGKPEHGTHVAGIIGAVRNNGIGVDGVADHIQIMTLRAVPDGDEHDKDIALAIRYAVDNGAKIINMSFGKSFSPEKVWVDNAIRYAHSKGVLLIHASGNDGKNLDSPESFNFPSPYFEKKGKQAKNFITVGASGTTATGELAADFSNYGKTKVDVFAPGVKIYSTMPGGNNYEFLQGTSMASPVVAGISALLLSYFPDLSAEQIKECIEKTAVNPNQNTTKPGDEEKVAFSSLSKTGGIVNAYEAVKYASTLKGKRKSSHKVN